MKIVNISQQRANNLRKYDIKCLNTEAILYYFSMKKKWVKEDKIFKKFFVTNGKEFSNKMYTINSLIDYKDKINIDELVIPDCLVSINSTIVGYAMDLINGVNLSQIIYDSKIDIKEKIRILKQIGEVLEKMKNVRKYTSVNDFYIGDIHEENIMVTNDGDIKVIDLDSSKILNNQASPTRYLQSLKRKGIIFNQKYNIDEVNPDIITPNIQTDYYCYMILLLNTLYQGDITKLDMKDFYLYLEFLKSIGINNELLDNLNNIYTSKPNHNIEYLLDSIGNEAYQARKEVFKMKTRF